MNELIRTLIVDDSAFVRKVVREMLSRSPYIEVVGAARDGQEALEMAEELKPAVITCDLTMPRMDGIGFVRAQMSRRPIPILILTASAQDGAGALEAMEAGAIDFIQKPNAFANEEIFGIREELVEKVKAASLAPMDRLGGRNGALAQIASGKTQAVNVEAVVIGISTGGPQALRKLIPQFPADFPVPIAVVLHMPIGYTRLFAEKLDEISELTVKEAVEGDVLRPGLLLIAQAGRHLAFRRAPAGHVQAQLPLQPYDMPHRPAVDVLFRSAAEVFGAQTLGVVMTGMGNDGKAGAAWIKAQGGTILTEAEESCIIYGMPRSVVECGLSDKAVPLTRMAKIIMEYL